MRYDRKKVQIALGAFDQMGAEWMCYNEYDGRDLELHVGDSNGEPDQAQVAYLATLLPELPTHEAECRRKLGCVHGHDLAGVLFTDGCDFVLAFDWGNGEWGRTVFVRMTSGKVIDADIVSD